MLSRMKLQVVWLCVVVVVVCGCGCGCGCGVCVRCGVVCGVTRLHPKRPRVYRQHVHTCKHMWVWCRYTRRRFERTHGRRENGGSSSVLLTKICNPWIFPFFSLRIGREQHVAESSISSLHVNTLFKSRHMTQRHTITATHNKTP